MLITYAAQDDPRFLDRADPAYWHPSYDLLLTQCRYETRPLGDFVSWLTYGPIITGQSSPRAAEGVAVVHQGQVAEAGVDLSQAFRVPDGCAWDLPRARLRRGDLVICRSGAGSVAKNRLAVFLSDEPAVVGSFVDLVRLDGLEPVYAALYLKTCFGWGQIHRLINGVATPNISFEEIRGLQIAVPPAQLQQDCRDQYLSEVLPWHEARRPEAGQRLQTLVAWLEQQLERSDRG